MMKESLELFIFTLDEYRRFSNYFDRNIDNDSEYIKTQVKLILFGKLEEVPYVKVI